MTRAEILYAFLLSLEWLLALAWLMRLVAWLRNAPGVTDLTRQPFVPLALEGDVAPQLSVIVPACNEEAAIEATLRSLLASEGIRLQIIAVNDRSTDRTGSIMHKVAAEWVNQELNKTLQHSLEVIDISKLPDGWLGKPHALATGAGRARAPWLLFTDGDVFFHPQALARAVACALQRQAGQLVLLPDLIPGSPGEAAMHGMMYALSLWGIQPWNVEKDKSKSFLGVGAFNLIQCSTYTAIGGFEEMRMEVLEDMRLGWKVKRAGLRPVAVFGPGLARVRWAHGAWGVVRNTEKNLFSMYRFRTSLALMGSLGLSLQVVVPVCLILSALQATSGFRWLAWLALTVHVAALVGLYRATRRVTHVPVGYVLLFPFALSLFVFAHLRSVFLGVKRGGILWRGTLYPLCTLRQHAGSWK